MEKWGPAQAGGGQVVQRRAGLDAEGRRGRLTRRGLVGGAMPGAQPVDGAGDLALTLAPGACGIEGSGRRLEEKRSQRLVGSDLRKKEKK